MTNTREHAGQLHVRLGAAVEAHLAAYCAATNRRRTDVIVGLIWSLELPRSAAPGAPMRRASAVPSPSALQRTGLHPTEVMAFVDDEVLFFVRDKASALWREVKIMRNNHGSAARPTVNERVPTGKTADDLDLDVWAMLQDGEAQPLNLKDERARAAVTNHPDYFEVQIHKVMVGPATGACEYVDAAGVYGPVGKRYTREEWLAAQRRVEAGEAEIIHQDNEGPGYGDFTTPIAALVED